MSVWCHAGPPARAARMTRHEAHVPAKQPAAQTDARISQADEHEDGQAGSAAPPRQGPQAPFRVVGNGPAGRSAEWSRRQGDVDRSLSRRDRIRRRSEFLGVQRQGFRIRGRHLTLFVLPNGLDRSRLGIIATRRLGGAVLRNRAKRLMRELFRHDRGIPGFDLVALLRPGFPDVRFTALESDYRATLRRHGRSRRRRPRERGPDPVPGRAPAAGRD